MSIAVSGFVLTLMQIPAARSQGAQQDGAWWKEQKLVFMWGQWHHARADKSSPEDADLPRQLFRNVAQAGGTVFAELRGYNPNHARFAHEFGMKYFATKFSWDLSHLPGRNWLKENGEEHRVPGLPYFKCPLDESVYDKWLVAPHLAGAREGLIDGIHIDWEYYHGNGEAKGVCYCDDCFAKFQEFKGIKEALPEKAKRFPWLKERNLAGAHEENFHNQRVAMFTRIRQKLQAVNPYLLFSSYGTAFSDFTQATNTPWAPFIFLDSRHYGTDDRQPWWESYSARLKQEGYLYVPGGWTNALFGAQASQVSAARWIYEASLNEDGVWLWFERELDDEILRACAAANRNIKTVERAVGSYLLHGGKDYNFVTAVEWTGRPELEQAVITRTYHLGQEHLLHINNVDADWPLRVRLRLPRLAEGKRWVVQDAVHQLYYSSDGSSPVWTTDELRSGVVVAMEPRSDVLLLVSPADSRAGIGPSQTIYSREFSVLPDHHAASATADAIRMTGAQTAAGDPNWLLYTSTEPMGFEGPEGLLTIGNAIRSVDARSGIGAKLRQLRGHLWSPSYSPDGARITFVHDAGGCGQIYVMNEDGSDAVNISSNNFCDRSPVWSPDGNDVAFLSDRAGDWDIYVMNADGSGQRRVAGNPGLDRAPAWSSDGKRIAWESYTSGMPNVWVCDADGENSRPLIAPDVKPGIRYVEEGAMEDGLFNFAEVERPFPDNTFFLASPVWSPDGNRIAAVIDGRGGYGSDIVVVEADGSAMLRITGGIGCSGNLAWSPDGTELAGTFRTPNESERAGIFVLNADRSDGHRGGNRLVDVRPQGPRLGGARRHGLMSWYSHGSAQPRRVVKTFTALAWSGDGETLAFSSDMDASGAFYVYTISPEGGEPHRVDQTKSAWAQQIMWRP